MSSRSSRLVPLEIERRLLFSYIAVFAVLLLIFAIVVHVAFLATFGREASSRLDTLARAGAAAVDPTKNGFAVDLNDETLRAMDVSTEGLEWYSNLGKRVAVIGLAEPRPTSSIPPFGETRWVRNGTVVRTLTIAPQITAVPPTRVIVRAIISYKRFVRPLRDVDVGILVGFTLAMIGSLLAGRILTRQALLQIETNMRSLQEFTADAAHELRGPLFAIAANAASGEAHDNGSMVIRRDRLASIESATAQMTRLTDDLLILARANQPLERELFALDLRARVAHVVDLYREQARVRNVKIEMLPGDAPRTYGNPDQVDRIVGNLVENAIRYTDPGGKVVVVCRADRAGARVVIADTGRGIAPGDRSRVFDRFWRADQSRPHDGGSGLGLAIARALAQRHGGDITLVTSVGVGSEFTVTFPAHPP